MLNSTTSKDKILTGLAEVIAPEGLLAPERVNLMDPGIDEHNLDAGIVVAPSSLREVQAIISWCASQLVPIVPHGGRTGLAGAAISQRGHLVLQTSHLNKILELDEAGGVAIVEPGVTLADLQQAAGKLGLSPGIDLGARDSATIGGMVSTNAGGQQSFRNGVMRHRVLGLEAVLGNGNILDDLKKVSKSNEGYALRHLLIGSEGTLGVITKIAIALLREDGPKTSALISCPSPTAAVKAYQRLRSQPGLELLAVEYMSPGYARVTADERSDASILAFEGNQDAVFLLVDAPERHDSILSNCLLTCSEHDEILGAIIAKSEAERSRFWGIREDVFKVDLRYPHGLSYDISLPVSHLPAYVDGLANRLKTLDPELRLFTIGHLADGNLHHTISSGHPIDKLKENIRRAVNEGLAGIGGSFSAEHGIGTEKRASLQENVPQHQLELMASIKDLFDPAGIMNPGKVL